MLCMDISGAFDNVSHARLLDNMKKRRIPEIITRWVASFLRERTTTIKVLEGVTPLMEVKTGIPQGSPISPILFLFFIADLLDTTNDEALRTSSIGFVDDTHILTYGLSTERNCRVLEQIHERCEEWSKTHGAKFAPKKYELIHFATRPKSFNMEASIRIGSVVKAPTSNVRVLGVQIDSKLKWGPHLAKIEKKYASQAFAIDRISASTWGASFKKARLIYSSVVRPSITYGASIWYTPQELKTSRKYVDRKLETLQNKSLRRILGAYRAVGSRILEREAAIPPISTVLTAHVANAAKRRLTGNGSATIRNACEKIRNRAPTRARNRKQTPATQISAWLRKIVPTTIWNKEIRQVTNNPFSNNGNSHGNQNRGKNKPKTWKETIRNHMQKRWNKLWSTYIATIPAGKTKSPAQRVTTSYRPKIHEGISKATTSLITQVRTEKIGLNAFLADCRVPGYSPQCSCGNSRQTAKHVLYYCPEHADKREALFKASGTRDYAKMLATTRGAKAAAYWLQQTGLLPQFSLGLGPEPCVNSILNSQPVATTCNETQSHLLQQRSLSE